MDPSTIESLETIGKIGFVTLGSKDLLLKLLGPSADYLGQEAQGLVKKCNFNVNRVFSNAWKKLGKKVEEPGEVNPRVLKEVYSEARFCEEDVLVDYYGGILASARNGDGKDDWAIPLLSKLKTLSSYQVAFHFFAYRAVYEMFRGSSLKMGTQQSEMKVFIPWHSFNKIVAAKSDTPLSIVHAATGLDSSGLIRLVCYGDADFLKGATGKMLPGYGVIVSPTLTGAELFLRSLGHNAGTGHSLLEHPLRFDDEHPRVAPPVARLDLAR